VDDGEGNKKQVCLNRAGVLWSVAFSENPTGPHPSKYIAAACIPVLRKVDGVTMAIVAEDVTAIVQQTSDNELHHLSVKKIRNVSTPPHLFMTETKLILQLADEGVKRACGLCLCQIRIIIGRQTPWIRYTHLSRNWLTLNQGRHGRAQPQLRSTAWMGDATYS